MAEPPSLDGAVHERLIVVVPLAVAVRPVGAPGTVEPSTLCGALCAVARCIDVRMAATVLSAAALIVPPWSSSLFS